MNQLYLQAAAAMSPADIQVLRQRLTAGSTTGGPASASFPKRRRNRISSVVSEQPEESTTDAAVSLPPSGVDGQSVAPGDSSTHDAVDSPTSANLPDSDTASQRKHPHHDWPEIDAELTADYFGVVYHAVVSPARKKLMSGRQLKILTGPEAESICDSLSEAMIVATEEQRRKQGLRRKGVANGWDFWQWNGK